MPRKKFLQDLEEAAKPGDVQHITQLQHGDDDGSIRFMVDSSRIVAVVPDLGDYPKEHMYILYTDSEEDVPPSVGKSLEALQPSLYGLSLRDMLNAVATTLTTADINHGTGVDVHMQQDALDEELDDFLSDVDDDEVFFPVTPRSQRDINTTLGLEVPGSLFERRVKRRIQADLRITKSAGFKIGIHGDLNDGGYLCISCRISKLGISEEAMKAWGVERRQYLMLIVHYKCGYFGMEQAGGWKHSGPEFRIGLCRRYKPSSNDVISKFHETEKDRFKHSTGTIVSSQNASSKNEIEDVFIEKSLNELMNKRFLPIVNARLSMCCSWTGGEIFMNESQGRGGDISDSTLNRILAATDVSPDSALSAIATADHLSESYKSTSLPLCMMQFTLRHFVRCTEFCLNCHCKIDASFEALKPYVCSKPLCLYQFMHLGFGPSIEWEILSQPFVADLLVSFCYTAALEGRLKDFPVGLGIDVPPPDQISRASDVFSGPRIVSTNPSKTTSRVTSSQASIKARFDRSELELLFADATKLCSVRVGQWMMIRFGSLEDCIHARVESTILWPTVKLCPNPIVPPKCTNVTEGKDVEQPASYSVSAFGKTDVTCYLYNVSFDTLSDVQKQDAVLMLLDTLPDVSSMKAYLKSKGHGSDLNLSNWQERISPSALDLLRWIIASNRSCIMQVDALDETLSEDSYFLNGQQAKDSKQAVGTLDDRIPGMTNCIQFRFAQGAPDKEQRFVESVQAVQQRLKLTHPTIFAWHGSPLSNWHGIVREGLHYKEVMHGRAFGHGVYLSQDYNTSRGYAYAGGRQGGGSGGSWPLSKLRISMAIALNEVVNAPAEFVHSRPHLVVKQVDWIQTRYLFVQGDPKLRLHAIDSTPSRVYEQDPNRTVKGSDGRSLVIPITAVSKSRRSSFGASAQTQGHKKFKLWGKTDDANAEETEDDGASMVTSASDRDFLLDDSDIEIIKTLPTREVASNVSPTKSRRNAPETDFVPGTLDPKTLPLLQEPISGSTVSSKSLQKALKAALAEQTATPMHELGWSIDANLISNIYQWIVELHSFDETLPLARDMKQKKVRSIVLEIRFTSNHPISPPFIRVIQPRFLDFRSGGGGHVTAGGAICMELLTNSGWSPVSSIESVLLQVRLAMSSTDPFPARLANSSQKTYGVGEAIEAYKRACAIHGWQYPKEFDDFATTK